MIAEIVGALAVVASLLFVGIQMRENTRATRSATASDTNAAISNWYIALGNNGQASSVLWKFLMDPESVSKEEQFQAVMNFHGILLTFQNSFYLVNEGTLDEQIYSSISRALLVVKDQPGFHYYWKQRREIFNTEFQAFVDQNLASDRTVSEDLFKATEAEQ